MYSVETTGAVDARHKWVKSKDVRSKGLAIWTLNTTKSSFKIIQLENFDKFQSLQKGGCANINDERIYLCFNSDWSEDSKRCRYAFEPEGNYTDEIESIHEHSATRIAASNSKSLSFSIETFETRSNIRHRIQLSVQSKSRDFLHWIKCLAINWRLPIRWEAHLLHLSSSLWIQLLGFRWLYGWLKINNDRKSF